MVLVDFFRNKHILITGATGFLGKVILYRFLDVIPTLGKIYVLIRNKKGSSVVERFKKEIIESPCFDKLRKIRPDFDAFIDSMVHPIAGDMIKENLALSPSDEQMLIDNVHIVINSAASIDFNSRLDEAININIKGTLRVYDLVRRMKRLENFVHISTAYVNCNLQGWIEERIYDIDQDPEKMIQDLLKIPVTELERQTSKIIGKYPNTYTFTKSMSERIMKIRNLKDKLPITIIRPSIIGCSYRDPVPGWVDTVSACGALILFSGIGIVKFLPGNIDSVGDQIPVDYVTDMIIVAAAYAANKRGKISVFHSGTSSKNPTTFRIVRDTMKDYFTRHPPEKRIGKPDFDLIENRKFYELQRLKRRIPAYMFYQFARVFGTHKIKLQANRLNKMLSRAEVLSETFSFFTTNQWIFETNKVTNLINFLSPEEQEQFQLDVTKIDWKYFFYHFNYGLQKYVLKENVQPPGNLDDLDLLTRPDSSYFSDIRWALQNGKNFQARSSKTYQDMIMNSTKVKECLQALAFEKVGGNNDAGVFQKALKDLESEAKAHCKLMFADYNMTLIRSFGWFLHKVFKRIYEKVVIDEQALDKLKLLEAHSHGPLVLIPTHRSYVDFLIVSYIFFAYRMKCPHIAAAEDFLAITIVHNLLRSSGAFFIKRKQLETDRLYKVIMTEYIQRILLDDCYLEFFMEGTRSRSGKMLSPKFGILTMITDLYFEKKLPDVHIVPITINYERVLEGETFPFELLGEEKVKESLYRIVKAAKILNMNFGRIYVEIAEPISMKQYTNSYIHDPKKYLKDPSLIIQRKEVIQQMNDKEVELMPKPVINPYLNLEQRKELVISLGYEIIYRMNEKLVIMPTALVAAVILMQRKGISEDALVERVEWLGNELVSRNSKLGSMNENSTSIAVRNAINHLDAIISKTKKDIFELSVSPKVDYKNTLLLSYYRNTLMHIFAMEAFIGCSMSAFGHQLAWKEGVSIERLWEESQFLMRLCQKEFIIREKVNNLTEFQVLLDRMKDRGVFEITAGKIKVKEGKGDQMVTFLSSLLWPLVDTYWVTVVFLFSMRANKSISLQKLIIQIQWFAESLYEERMLEHYESCSQDTIKNALGVFKTWDVVNILKEVVPPGKEKIEVVKLVAKEERLRNIEDHLKKFQKYLFAKSVTTPIDVARKSILVDYPFMAKI